MVTGIPIDWMLIESDASYLSPPGNRGTNTPYLMGDYNPMRRMVKGIPLDWMLIESYAYLSPPGNRGINTPYLMGDLVQYIAFVRNLALRKVLELTRSNACTFYKLPY